MPTEDELDAFRSIHLWSKTSNNATTNCSKTMPEKAKKVLQLQDSKPAKDCSTSTISKVRSQTAYRHARGPEIARVVIVTQCGIALCYASLVLRSMRSWADEQDIP